MPAAGLAAPDDTAPPAATGQVPVPNAALDPAEQPPEVARKLHLDTLFAELAQPDNENWRRTEAQIQALWSRSGSDSMDLLTRRAQRAIEAKDYETASVHLNDLVRLAPDYAEGWNRRATLHFMREDYGRSLDDIARTLELEPRHYGALSGLGIILDRLGDQSSALEAYRRAVAIHPNLEGAQAGIDRLAPDVDGERL